MNDVRRTLALSAGLVVFAFTKCTAEIGNAPLQGASETGSAWGFEAVGALGILTAISMLTTLSFSIFRVRFKDWTRYHKTAAYITAALMLIHGGMALSGWFLR